MALRTPLANLITVPQWPIGSRRPLENAAGFESNDEPPFLSPNHPLENDAGFESEESEETTATQVCKVNVFIQFTIPNVTPTSLPLSHIQLVSSMLQ